MKLHGAPISPNVRKAIIGFNVKGVEFEANNIVPGPELKKPEFLKINPLGMIPALEDGDMIIGDSNVILHYLEDKYPEPSILPSDPKDRAKCRWLAEYAGAALFPCCGVMFREVFVNPNFFKQPTNQEAVTETENIKFPPVLDYLEANIPAQEFLFGNSISIADISVMSMFIAADYGGYNVDEDRWPKLAAYVKRSRTHPAIAKCVKAEKEFIKSISG